MYHKFIVNRDRDDCLHLAVLSHFTHADISNSHEAQPPYHMIPVRNLPVFTSFLHKSYSSSHVACNKHNCSVPSQFQCKIHSKSSLTMEFCTFLSCAYGLSSKCFDLCWIVINNIYLDYAPITDNLHLLSNHPSSLSTHILPIITQICRLVKVNICHYVPPRSLSLPLPYGRNSLGSFPCSLQCSFQYVCYRRYTHHSKWWNF